MAKKRSAAPKEVHEETTVPKAVSEPKPVHAVAVHDKAGKLVRVYSEDQHGDDYEKLADEFVSHNDGFNVKPYVAPPKPVPAAEETEKVTVYHPSGDVVRVYSFADHGEDYVAMAEGFVERYPKRKYRLGSLKDE
jgi:hypothetical protein